MRTLATWTLGALASGVLLLGTPAWAKKSCTKGCDEDATLCTSMCKKHAGKNAGKCVEYCNAEKKACTEECTTGKKRPKPKGDHHDAH